MDFKSFRSKKKPRSPLEHDNLDKHIGLERTSTSFDINFEKVNSIINEDTIILITDKVGYIIYVNDKCCISFGYEQEELLKMRTSDLSTGYHSKEFYRILWETVLDGRVWRGEITDRRKDGSIAWHFMSIFPLLDENGQPHQFLTLRTDISEQKELEKRALQIEKQLNSHFEMANDVMGCCDQDGNILYVNAAYEKMLGYNSTELVAAKIFDSLGSEEAIKVQRLLEELLSKPEQSLSVEVTLQSKNRTLITCDAVFKNYIHDPMIKGIVFHFHDITEQKRIIREIGQSSYFDFLTGLPNRKAFERQLQESIKQSYEQKTAFSVLLLDIDNFKYINDSFEHEMGDLLLKKFASRLATYLHGDEFIGRIGGDEFAIILHDANDVDTLQESAAQLVSLINKKSFQIHEYDFFLSISIGICVYPYSGENKQTLLKNAEIAMYRAKRAGKNQYQIFSPVMSIDKFKQFTLRNDSRKALLNDEFCFFYQPRIDPRTNELISAEALLRWNHPQWGMLMPNEFIPMLEESGLLIPIGEWMIRKICHQIKKWEEEITTIKPISVNLSAQQLRDPNFVDTVTSILKESRVSPRWLEFEITESVMIENEQSVFETVTKLNTLGVQFALDDFGTGYSSLNIFRKFHCKTIKIDKSVIKDIHTDDDTYEIIKMIIVLCHRLKKYVVAEGVETSEQLQLLQRLRCDEIQGNFYSKPMDVLEFTKLLQVGKWTSGDKQDLVEAVNRRNYFRVPLVIPLVADMTIEKIGTRKLNIGSSEVLLHDISPGGLCFQSSLRLPVKQDITLQFKTEILAGTLQVKGKIVWQEELNNNDYKYGVQFILDEIGTENLIKILNQFQIQLKQKNRLPNSRFLT